MQEGMGFKYVFHNFCHRTTILFLYVHTYSVVKLQNVNFLNDENFCEAYIRRA